jgi:hypothetical protein
VIQDDNSADGIPDFRIEHPHGQMGYVEVTTDLERDYGNMLGVISKSKGHTRELPMRIEAPQLDRVWFATLSSSANVKEIVTKLPGILAASTPAAMPELGIVRLDSRPAGNDSGVILLYPDGISGSIDVTWAEALEALNGILGSPRLSPSTRSYEKHLEPRSTSFLAQRLLPHGHCTSPYRLMWIPFHIARQVCQEI